MLSSKFAVCDSQKLRLIKEQKASGLLSRLETKTCIDKITIFGPISN